MSLDATSASAVKAKPHASCFGGWRLPPLVERIVSVVRSTRIRSKRILAGNPLFFWRRERTTRHDTVDISEALNELSRGTVLAEKCVIGRRTWTLWLSRYRLSGRGSDADLHVRRAVNISSGDRVFLHFYDDLASLMAAEAHHGSASSAGTCRCVCSFVRGSRLDSRRRSRWINTVCDVTDCPPFLVFEGGDYTFDQWIAQSNRQFDERRYAMREVSLRHRRDSPENSLDAAADPRSLGGRPRTGSSDRQSESQQNRVVLGRARLETARLVREQRPAARETDADAWRRPIHRTRDRSL